MVGTTNHSQVITITMKSFVTSEKMTNYTNYPPKLLRRQTRRSVWTFLGRRGQISVKFRLTREIRKTFRPKDD